MVEKVKIKKIYEDAILPKIAVEDSAGCDLYAHLNEEKLAINPHTTVKVSSGIAVAVPKGYAGLIFARSGLATKRGLRPANAVGVVDCGYTGEVIVALHNDTDFTQYIDNKERIAQFVIVPFLTPDWEVVDELDKTERGDGGFGSTGK